MVLFVTAATIIFFSFLGSLCNKGQQDFCDKFRSGERVVRLDTQHAYHTLSHRQLWCMAEIMQMGYLLFFSMLVIGSTAFMRHTPLSTFYLFHGLILLLHWISIIHTFDRAHRSGEKFRSQNVKWFSAPLLFYLCDYAMLYINQRFWTEARSFIAMKSQGISRMDC